VSDPIVDVQDLRKTYRTFFSPKRRRVEAVRGVSLQAYPGEIFGLLGPNGAGKTTLIKMLLGVVGPTAGTARLFDQPIGRGAARRRVGYLPESLRVDRHHTARSALRYYGRMSRMPDSLIRQRSDELLRLVGLATRDRESVRRFSKGMYQRLGLAQALLHDPDLLVLDEPTDGLDPVGRNEVRRVIERLRESGKTIFLNSHILQEVEMVCTRVAILARGQIQAIGPIDSLSQHDESQLTVDLAVPPSGPARATGPMPGGPPPVTADDRRGVAVWQDLLTERVDVQQADDVGSALRLMLTVSGQSDIDFVIDRLRDAGHSIRQVRVSRESLEQAFIRLVGSADGDSPGGEGA